MFVGRIMFLFVGGAYNVFGSYSRRIMYLVRVMSVNVFVRIMDVNVLVRVMSVNVLIG